jgi:hypothetical protein
MLLADSPDLPQCDLGAPSTKRRDKALQQLRAHLKIGIVAAEKLLTASSLLGANNKENLANAQYLAEEIKRLQANGNSGH